ncbi:Cysteine desulfurase IscS [Clarias magur]|uniref:Cysteine desulfurase IscS n=1 Tax=Clarias magur TaxID=1594786 RepID=A0A8J4U472_CLAMG|nr:Cysteine desulfurase IscS [Clarias magur]
MPSLQSGSQHITLQSCEEENKSEQATTTLPSTSEGNLQPPSRHRALRDDPPAPTLTHALLQMSRHREVESTVSRAEPPAGLPENHKDPEEPPRNTRRGSLNILPSEFCESVADVSCFCRGWGRRSLVNELRYGSSQTSRVQHEPSRTSRWTSSTRTSQEPKGSSEDQKEKIKKIFCRLRIFWIFSLERVGALCQSRNAEIDPEKVLKRPKPGSSVCLELQINKLSLRELTVL